MALIHPAVMEWIIIPVLIVVSRIFDVTIGTLRIIFVARGMKLLAPTLGFFEVLIWLIVISHVMNNLDNPLNILAYAGGFALGNYVGINIENRLAMGMALIRFITAVDASEVVGLLRDSGYRITSVDATGNRGPVTVFFTIVRRREIKQVVQTIKEYNPNAFYTVEDVGFVSQIQRTMVKTRRKWRHLFVAKRK